MTNQSEGPAAEKAIKWTDSDRHRWILMAQRYSSDNYACQAQPTQLALAGYVPASRLLAVEAELGKLKAERAHLEEAAELLRGPWLKAGTEHSDVAQRLRMWVRRDQAAPPSLAEQHPGLEKMRGDIDPVCDPVAPEPAQEAGGVERVTHHEAAVMLQALTETHSPAGLHWLRLEKLELYRQQQEQSEREAALQLLEIQGLYAAFRGSGHSPKNPREAAQAIMQLWDDKRDWMALADEPNTTKEDRDAERTQKEALETELDLHKRALADYQATSGDLRAENEGLKAKLKDRDICWHCKDTLLEPDGRPHCESCPAEGDCDDAACSEDGCREERAKAGQAGSVYVVAPVAKAEAPSEPDDADPGRSYRCKHLRRIDGAIVDGCGWQGPRTERCPICNSNRFHRLAEAPSEPAGWVPARGEAVVLTCAPHHPLATTGRVTNDTNGRRSFLVRIDYDHSYVWVDLADLKPAEPAPQPPATTGGADRPVMMGELVAALKRVAAELAKSGARNSVPGYVMQDTLNLFAEALEANP